MKQEEKEWWKAIWKFTKAMIRLVFVVGSVVLAYTGIGLSKVAEWMAEMNNKMS